MQVILDSSFARPGSAPIWGGKKGEFRDWTMVVVAVVVCGWWWSGGGILGRCHLYSPLASTADTLTIFSSILFCTKEGHNAKMWRFLVFLAVVVC